MKDWEPTSFRAWKSLDEPLSFFGIKGRFMVVFLIIGGFAGMTSLALGNTFGRIVTLLFLAAALIADYLFILRIQNRYSEREFARMLNKNRIRMHVKVLPECITAMMEDISDGDEDTK